MRSELPAAVWLCPKHADEFWVPHDGLCPEAGCGETLIKFVPVAEIEVPVKVDIDPQRMVRVVEETERKRGMYRNEPGGSGPFGF